MSVIPPPRLVIVESPFRPTEHRTAAQHREYLRCALADCIRRGESPFASHHLTPEVLRDDSPYERALGIRLGLAWGAHADLIAVYSQLGCSSGMMQAIQHYKEAGKRIEWREIPLKQFRQILAMELAELSQAGVPQKQEDPNLFEGTESSASDQKPEAQGREAAPRTVT